MYFYFLCMIVLPTCLCVHHVYIWYLWRLAEDAPFGIVVTDSCGAGNWTQLSGRKTQALKQWGIPPASLQPPPASLQPPSSITQPRNVFSYPLVVTTASKQMGRGSLLICVSLAMFCKIQDPEGTAHCYLRASLTISCQLSSKYEQKQMLSVSNSHNPYICHGSGWGPSLGEELAAEFVDYHLELGCRVGIV